MAYLEKIIPYKDDYRLIHFHFIEAFSLLKNPDNQKPPCIRFSILTEQSAKSS